MELKLTLEDYDRLVSRLEGGTGGNKIMVKKEILNNLIDDYVNLLNELDRKGCLDNRKLIV